jgi:hypothetical protein
MIYSGADGGAGSDLGFHQNIVVGEPWDGFIFNIYISRTSENSMDELFASYESATEKHLIKNIGKQELVLYKLFGPDVKRAAIIYT